MKIMNTLQKCFYLLLSCIVVLTCGILYANNTISLTTQNLNAQKTLNVRNSTILSANSRVDSQSTQQRPSNLSGQIDKKWQDFVERMPELVNALNNITSFYPFEPKYDMDMMGVKEDSISLQKHFADYEAHAKSLRDLRLALFHALEHTDDPEITAIIALHTALSYYAKDYLYEFDEIESAMRVYFRGEGKVGVPQVLAEYQDLIAFLSKAVADSTPNIMEYITKQFNASLTNLRFMGSENGIGKLSNDNDLFAYLVSYQGSGRFAWWYVSEPLRNLEYCKQNKIANCSAFLDIEIETDDGRGDYYSAFVVPYKKGYFALYGVNGKASDRLQNPRSLYFFAQGSLGQVEANPQHYRIAKIKTTNISVNKADMGDNPLAKDMPECSLYRLDECPKDMVQIMESYLKGSKYDKGGKIDYEALLQTLDRPTFAGEVALPQSKKKALMFLWGTQVGGRGYPQTLVSLIDKDMNVLYNDSIHGEAKLVKHAKYGEVLFANDYASGEQNYYAINNENGALSLEVVESWESVKYQITGFEPPADWAKELINRERYGSVTSFDCENGNLNNIEEQICADFALTLGDRILNEFYNAKYLNASGEAKKKLFNAQMDWLEKRNQCRGGNIACLYHQISGRIKEIKDSVR
ncbi:hypothetical protein CQA53_00210 [Helicobacter didelphidarum]|uniref:Lysozyme inhibitor LprI N-terminal domain-containing protein n=1 Tax=Helicobacter didelphidarum TaxID=2040648 RepID=A0A3D8IR84_9HELI|nr:hypothetical protein [Helicobacter didelphidarum]RDU67490.1 hypothetical protein CQA53_00210 [Helicobacter didelphidarum]